MRAGSGLVVVAQWLNTGLISGNYQLSHFPLFCLKTSKFFISNVRQDHLKQVIFSTINVNPPVQSTQIQVK